MQGIVLIIKEKKVSNLKLEFVRSTVKSMVI